jgi:hypothetical protein
VCWASSGGSTPTYVDPRNPPDAALGAPNLVISSPISPQSTSPARLYIAAPRPGQFSSPPPITELFDSGDAESSAWSLS